MRYPTFLPASMLFLLALACAVSGGQADGDGSADGGESGDPTPSDVSSCKESCDSLQFFDCIDAAGQMECYDKCEVATSDAIERFTSCEDNDVCDPECLDALEPGHDPTASGGDEVGGGPTTAGGDSSGDTDCAGACDRLLDLGCLAAQNHASCRVHCGVADEPAVDTFVACSFGSVCDETCYAVFNPADTLLPTDSEIDDCRMGCELLATFDCITAAEQSTCFDGCDTADRESLLSFVSCAEAGLCEDSSCLDEFPN